MKDEQIIEYLRSRAQVGAPPDLVSSVLDAVDAAPPRRAWFAPFVPALATAAAVSVVLALAVLMGQRLNIGPSPEPALTASPTPAPTETASAEPSLASVQPSASATTDDLTQPGDSVEISAVDATGEWGTILIRRGGDRGGYPDVAIGTDTFTVEVFIRYTAERLPEPAQFGYPDWVLRPTDRGAEHDFAAEPQRFEADPGSPAELQPLLGLYPGAIDVFSTPTEGWIIFEVARREANLQLELAYWPAGFDAPVETIIGRAAGPPPAPEP